MRLILAAVLSLGAGPALAEWSLADLSNEQEIAYSGGVLDVSGTIDMGLDCSDWIPGLITLTIFTGEPAATAENDGAEGIMTVTADGRKRREVTAHLSAFDGETAIVTSNVEGEKFIELLLLMAKAQETLEVDYAGRHYQFTAEGANAVIGEMADVCPQ